MLVPLTFPFFVHESHIYLPLPPPLSFLDKIPSKGKPGDNFFQLQAKDKNGNPKKTGGDDVKVVLRKKIEREAEIVDNGDGSYSVKHPHGLDPGDYKVSVSMGGKPLANPTMPQKGKLSLPLLYLRLNYLYS